MQLFIHWESTTISVEWIRENATFFHLIEGFVQWLQSTDAVNVYPALKNLRPSFLQAQDQWNHRLDDDRIVAKSLNHKDDVFLVWRSNPIKNTITPPPCVDPAFSLSQRKPSSSMRQTQKITARERIGRLFNRFGPSQYNNNDSNNTNSSSSHFDANIVNLLFSRENLPREQRKKLQDLISARDWSAPGSSEAVGKLPRIGKLCARIQKRQKERRRAILIPKNRSSQEETTTKKSSSLSSLEENEVKEEENNAIDDLKRQSGISRIARLRRRFGSENGNEVGGGGVDFGVKMGRGEGGGVNIKTITPVVATVIIADENEDEEEEEEEEEEEVEISDESDDAELAQESEDSDDFDEEEEEEKEKEIDISKTTTPTTIPIPSTTKSSSKEEIVAPAVVNPSLENIVQSQCVACSSTIFYPPRADTLICRGRGCGARLTSVECPRCATLFSILSSKLSSPTSCPTCRFSAAGSEFAKRRSVDFSPSPPPPAFSIPPPPRGEQKEIHLILQYYIDKDDARRREVDACLTANVALDSIRHIHILTEKPMDFRSFQHRDKIVQHQISHWLSYSDVFLYANRFLRGNIVVFANADIHFDRSLDKLKNLDLRGRCLALSRHDLRQGGGLVFNRQVAPVSQDAWIFQSPLDGVAANFAMGKPGCDNRIAYELRRCGVRVTNPAESIIAIHLHASEKRNYQHGKDTIEGPYSAVVPCPHLT